MKKLIIIFILISTFANAQIKETSIFGKNIQNDKIDHFTISLIGSAFITTISYKWLCENTDLSPFWCKLISGNVGFWVTIGLGEFKENTDLLFNPYDMEANKLGALSGVFAIEGILFRSISEKQLRKKELLKELENN